MTLKSWINKFERINTAATYRAMNKAASKVNTQYKREITRATGLKSKDISKRFKVKKANSKSLTAFVSMGTKFGVSLAAFKPKLKQIKKNGRKYSGVTVKIGNTRELVPGGFLRTMKSGKSLVLARTSQSKYPIKALSYKLVEAAKSMQVSLQQLFSKEFKENFSKQMQYEFKK